MGSKTVPVFGNTTSHHHSGHRLLFFVESPNTRMCINIPVIIEILQCPRFHPERHGEHAECVRQPGHTMTVSILHPLALLYQLACLPRMYVTDKNRSFVHFTVPADRRRQPSALFYQFDHLSPANHPATLLPDSPHQAVCYQCSVTLQPPTAFNKTALAMKESEKRKRIAPKLHLQGSPTKHVHQQRIAESLIQILPSTRFNET